MHSIEHRIGKGGVGTVYAAIKSCDNMPVAIKEVKKEKVLTNIKKISS